MTPNKNSRVPKRKSRKNLWLAIGIIAIIIMIIGVYAVIGNSSQAPNSTAQHQLQLQQQLLPLIANVITTSSATSTKVLLHTSIGDITIQLRNDMPITTGNFKNLVQKGTYDGTIFHRVINRFHDSRRRPNWNWIWRPINPNY